MLGIVRMKIRQPIETLVQHFESEGNANVKAECGEVEIFTSEEWNAKSIIKSNFIIPFGLPTGNYGELVPRTRDCFS